MGQHPCALRRLRRAALLARAGHLGLRGGLLSGLAAVQVRARGPGDRREPGVGSRRRGSGDGNDEAAATALSRPRHRAARQSQESWFQTLLLVGPKPCAKRRDWLDWRIWRRICRRVSNLAASKTGFLADRTSRQPKRKMPVGHG